MFQSTHPRGVRLLQFSGGELAGLVSIHAPAWGATCLTSRLRVDLRFQSTHPRGVRLPGFAHIIICRTGFNPRTRVGCDPRPVLTCLARM